MPKIGAHESVSGGLHLAFERIRSVGGRALQIFSRNQRQWNPAPLSQDEIVHFRDEWQKVSDMEVVSHASYLINLASARKELQHQSIEAFVLELERCRQLGIDKVVLHPGSHGGDGIEAGIERCIAGLDQAIAAAESDTVVLIETTAGQGTGLGSSFDEISNILAGSRYQKRLAVCVDTCHIFAAGYDIRNAESYISTMSDFDRIIGCGKIAFFHLNDSKKELSSRVDRHEHIGQGCIGLDGFRQIVNDPRFASLSMALETPKEKDLADDKRNLRRLAGLVS